MPTLTVHLSDGARLDAERRAAEGGFESIEAYIASLVEQDAADESQLRALLSRRAAAADAGEMGANDFDAIRAKVRSCAQGRAG